MRSSHAVMGMLLCLTTAGCQSDRLAGLVGSSPGTTTCPYASQADRPNRIVVSPKQAKPLDQPSRPTGDSREEPWWISAREASASLSEPTPTGALARDIDVLLASGETSEELPAAEELTTADASTVSPEPYAPAPLPENVRLLDLPTALALVGGTHPVVGFAQWRVEEAYAGLDSANAMWLPSLNAGFSFHRHDGNLQASNGSIDDVNRSSLQAGLGAGAVGAGTTPIPGIVARFHVSDAIFQPRIAQRTAWARQHAATAACQDQLLAVALAYLNLLAAEQELRVVQEAHDRTVDLAKLTADYAHAGQGLQADADRLATELILVESRLLEARELRESARVRLLEAVSLEPDCQIAITDPALVPIDLVSIPSDCNGLITTALSHRPELKEAQCLVAAACEEFERQRYAPFVPSVLLGLSETGFGGGLSTTADDFDDRMDFDAIAVWEIRNLGLGEHAARCETAARVQQTRYQQLQTMDRVARQVTEACTQAAHRGERLLLTRRAIDSARDSYDRNVRRIREGQGLPLEVLQSMQALEQAQRAYLDAVTDYNEAQFRLQWALGWPVTAGHPQVP